MKIPRNLSGLALVAALTRYWGYKEGKSRRQPRNPANRRADTSPHCRSRPQVSTYRNTQRDSAGRRQSQRCRKAGNSGFLVKPLISDGRTPDECNFLRMTDSRGYCPSAPASHRHLRSSGQMCYLHCSEPPPHALFQVPRTRFVYLYRRRGSRL
jgi:hypothetical protein